MVFDGEGLAYYYKDLEKATWWKSQTANWNKALSEAITANKSYIKASVSCWCPYIAYILYLLKTTTVLAEVLKLFCIRKRDGARTIGMKKNEHSMITCSKTMKKHVIMPKSSSNGHQLAIKENSIMVFSSQKPKSSLQNKSKLLLMAMRKTNPSFKVSHLIVSDKSVADLCFTPFFSS